MPSLQEVSTSIPLARSTSTTLTSAGTWKTSPVSSSTSKAVSVASALGTDAWKCSMWTWSAPTRGEVRVSIRSMNPSGPHV